jgi:hypothetical protein
MADQAISPSAPSEPRQRVSRYFAALRVPLMLVCILAAALGGYYVFYVSQQTSYLITRNFRLLATIGEHIEAAIRSDQTVLSNMRSGEESLKNVKDEAAKFIPFIKSAKILNWPKQTGRHAPVPEGAMALQFVEPNTRVAWELRDLSYDDAAPWQVQLSLDDLVEPLLRDHVNDGTFDALLVAAPDGRVIFQTGAAPLRVMNLARLVVSKDAKGVETGKFDDLAHAAGLADVVVAGDQYKLFTQPCCGLISTTGKSPSSPASPASSGWVLAGLTSQRSVTAQSYAVSFSILAVISIALLLALLSWPFVKLLLIGDAQRVKVHDVVLVGTSALVGIALITISALDLYAYKTLEATLDDQLETFAREITERANDEIKAAVGQLSQLEAAVDRPEFPGPKFPEEQSVNDLAAVDDRGVPLLLSDTDLRSYPDFESFSLINEIGEQRQKMTLGSFVTPRIVVDDREYFIHWTTPVADPAPFFEPIQSATTGAREAVVSTRTKSGRVAALSIPMRTLIKPIIVPGFGFVAINDAGKVLFHSDPQHSLSEDFFVESDNNQRLRALVVARHQEWVSIKYWGEDHRAFVFPMHIAAQPFTLITFYDKNNVQAVNTDWLVITATLLLMYSGTYIGACIAILIAAPKYRASWLWPDPARSKQYLDLVPPLFLLATGMAIGLAVLRPADLVLLAWLIPFLAWVGVYTVLARRHNWRALWMPCLVAVALLAMIAVVVSRVDSLASRILLGLVVAAGVAEFAVAVWRRVGRKRSPLAPPVNISYGLAAALLVLIVSVLPAAAFFRVGHGLQIESFIKYGQLRVALNRIEQTKLAEKTRAEQVPDASFRRLVALRKTNPRALEWGTYERFFFDTRPLDAAAAESAGCRTGVATADTAAVEHRNNATIAETIEEYLPFYSESSVNLREMVHNQASDGRWRWRWRGVELAFCAPSGTAAGLRSEVPPFFDVSQSSLRSQKPFVLLLLGLVAVLATVVWVVRFIITKVFLADVIEPLSSERGEALREIWAPNLFLVGEPPPASDIPELAFCQIDLSKAPDDAAARSEWFADQLTRVEQSAVRQNVLMLHYERKDDAAFAEQKLALLERIIHTLNRTLVVVSAVPPSVAGAPSLDSQDSTQADMTHRWDAVLSRFTVVPVMPVAPAPPMPQPALALGGWSAPGWREIVWRLSALGFSHSARFLEQEQQDPRVDRLWREVLPYAWHPERPPLDVGQLLVEVGERAENYYREIWATCTREDKLVLGQLAEEGLVNYKAKATLRRLMARGLVRREPHFELMNETFRRFVLSSFSRTEVAALEEDSTTSAWDAIRWPFLALLVGSLAFLFVTQHELFNTTVGVITAVAAAVPAIVKMANIFGERRASG